MESLYLLSEACPIDWPRPTAVAVTPLLAALIGHLGGDALSPEQRERALGVVFDSLTPSETVAIHAPLPVDSRGRQVALALRAHPDDRRDIESWGALASTSGRTIARIFRSETGLTFGEWRTATRVQAALLLLAEGQSVTRVGMDVGYETPSAFVAAFRKHTGTTPGAYFWASA
jgi:AraC-like DNA-binding protein